MKLLKLCITSTNNLECLHRTDEGENHRCCTTDGSIEGTEKYAEAFPHDPDNKSDTLIYIDFVNSQTVTYRHEAKVLTVDCLEDITAHPEKVQKAAALIFTPEVKAAYIASLPTVDEPVMAMRQVTVDLPVMIANPDYDAEVEGSQKQIQKTETVLVDVEETTVLEGAVQKVVKAHQAEQEQGVVVTTGVIDEAGAKVMEEYDTGEVVTKIQYKGELYASARDLL